VAVSININNWVKTLNRQGEVVFGQIVAIEPATDNQNMHWIKMRLTFNHTTNQPINTMYSFSSVALTQVEMMHVFDPEDGSNLNDMLRLQASQAAAQAAPVETGARESVEASIPTQTQVRDVELVQSHPFGDLSRITVLPDHATIRAWGTDVWARTRPTEPTEPAEPQVEKPNTVIHQVDPNVIPTPEGYTLKIGSGDLHTIAQIADTNPDLVFKIIDEGIDKIGHMLLHTFGDDLVSTLIRSKIDLERSTVRANYEPKNLYNFSKILSDGSTGHSKLIYIGGESWFVCKGESNIPTLPQYNVVIMTGDILDEYDIIHEDNPDNVMVNANIGYIELVAVY